MKSPVSFRTPVRFLVVLTALGIWCVKAADSSNSPQPPAPPSEAEKAGSDASDKPFMADIRTKMMEDLLKMREFFDTTVPGTLKKYNLVLGFSPRASDVRKGEFVRLPATVRYGLSNRWEISGGVTPFCPNPIDNGKDHRWGMGMAGLGLRYNWGHWGQLFDQVTIGVEGRTPLGKPPVDLIDYQAHVRPYINTSRPLPIPHTTLYTNVSYDRSLDAPWRQHEPLPEGVLTTHVFTVTPSILYMPGEFGAFLEYNWRWYRVNQMGTHFGHEFKIGPIWDVPLWRTQSWGLPGKWQVELGARLTLEEGHDPAEGVSVRVRWRTSLHEVFSKKSYERRPPQ
jgi:hypothetical protein